jgi:hypothetical protein
MTQPKDLTDLSVGHLLVLKRAPNRWICRCSCGRIIERREDQLLEHKNCICNDCARQRPTATDIKQRRKEAYEKSICKRVCETEGCENEFIGSTREKYCTECKKERAKQHKKEYKQRIKELVKYYQQLKKT